MSGMIAHPKTPLDDVGDPLEGPTFRVETVAARSLKQVLSQIGTLVRSQARDASSPACSTQGGRPLPLPCLMPAAGALPRDLEFTRDLGLGASTSKVSGGLQTAGLFARIIHAQLRIPFHVCDIPYLALPVIRFCKHQ